MLQFSADQIKTMLPCLEIVKVIRQSFLAMKSKDYYVPDRLHVERDGLTFLLMPAFSEKYFCTKLVSVVPANPGKGLPLISGTLSLNDAVTGQVLAQFDAPMITALRTGAVGALALELLTQPAINQMGLIGCGVQGIWQTIFAASIRPIQKIFCYTRSTASFLKYKDAVHAVHPNLELLACKSADEVVRSADLIYTCTTSSEPVFSNDSNLVVDKQFISVGSFRKEMQEVPDAVYKAAEAVVLDTATAIEEVGDLIFPLQKEIIKAEAIYLMQDVLADREVLNAEKVSVFKSVGMAAFDLALASALYETSLDKKT